MYRDVIQYKLAQGISEDHLVKVANQIIDTWMKDLKGFVNLEITKSDEGQYIDIVHWSSREDAKNAEKEMCNIPNAMDWYSCYDQASISSHGVEVINSTS